MGTIYRNGTAFIGSGGAGGVELTQAEYDALPTTEKMNGSIYFISDGEASYPSASTMRYDNSYSGLAATSVQAAVDEVNEKVNDNAGDIATLNNGLLWKFVGQATGGNNPVSINSLLPTAKEFLIVAAIDNGGNKESILVPRAEISGNSWFRAGGYTTASTPVLVTVLINNNVSLIHASLGTTDYTSTSVVKVYYR